MNDEILWNTDEPIRDCAPAITVPEWVEQDITPSTVAAIMQGGCASGAYMPAVTYHQALATMNEHSGDVFDLLDELSGGDIPKPGDDCQSWEGLACFFLSAAVEMWADLIAEELSDALEDDSDDE